MGKAAYQYGTPASQVELFLTKFMEQSGYQGSIFRATRTELFCGFSKSTESVQTLQLVEIRDNLELNKLGLLSDLADDIIAGDKKQEQSLSELKERLHEIEKTAPPYGMMWIFLSYLSVGGGVADLLGGSWWDVLFGTLVSIPTFVLTVLFGKWNIGYAAPLVTAFLNGVIATAFKYVVPEINVTLVVLSGVAIALPGYGFSLGTAELVSNHVIAGTSRLIDSSIMLLWLVGGGFIGYSVIVAIGGDVPNELSESVPMAWQALFAPLLMISLNIVFQNPMRFLPAATLVQGVAYGTSYLAGSVVKSPNLGIFLGSFLMTLAANGIANWKKFPVSAVILPAIIFMVSGTIGFRGLMNIVAGETQVGAEQVHQMFITALLIFAGLLVGNLLLGPRTTL